MQAIKEQSKCNEVNEHTKTNMANGWIFENESFREYYDISILPMSHTKFNANATENEKKETELSSYVFFTHQLIRDTTNKKKFKKN